MGYCANIKKSREEHGFSREQFAASIGKDPSYIKDVEEGLVNPTAGEIKTLANVVGLTCSAFLGA